MEAVIIKRDGKEVARVKNDISVLAWHHEHHSYSMWRALKYEGYSHEDIELEDGTFEIDEKGIVSYVKMVEK